MRILIRILIVFLFILPISKSFSHEKIANSTCNLFIKNIIDNYETELKRDERIMRYLNVKLDKYATEWSVKRRSRMKKEKV